MAGYERWFLLNSEEISNVMHTKKGDVKTAKNNKKPQNSELSETELWFC